MNKGCTKTPVILCLFKTPHNVSEADFDAFLTGAFSYCNVSSTAKSLTLPEWKCVISKIEAQYANSTHPMKNETSAHVNFTQVLADAKIFCNISSAINESAWTVAEKQCVEKQISTHISASYGKHIQTYNHEGSFFGAKHLGNQRKWSQTLNETERLNKTHNETHKHNNTHFNETKTHHTPLNVGLKPQKNFIVGGTEHPNQQFQLNFQGFNSGLNFEGSNSESGLPNKQLFPPRNGNSHQKNIETFVVSGPGVYNKLP